MLQAISQNATVREGKAARKIPQAAHSVARKFPGGIKQAPQESVAELPVRKDDQRAFSLGLDERAGLVNPFHQTAERFRALAILVMRVTALPIGVGRGPAFLPGYTLSVRGFKNVNSCTGHSAWGAFRKRHRNGAAVCLVRR